jgi:hypothetical protein
VRRAGLLRTRAHRRGRVSLRRMLQDKVLTPGTYVLTVASLDETGRVSSTANVKFWVIAPKPRR